MIFAINSSLKQNEGSRVLEAYCDEFDAVLLLTRGVDFEANNFKALILKSDSSLSLISGGGIFSDFFPIIKSFQNITTCFRIWTGMTWFLSGLVNCGVHSSLWILLLTFLIVHVVAEDNNLFSCFFRSSLYIPFFQLSLSFEFKVIQGDLCH